MSDRLTAAETDRAGEKWNGFSYASIPPADVAGLVRAFVANCVGDDVSVEQCAADVAALRYSLTPTQRRRLAMDLSGKPAWSGVVAYVRQAYEVMSVRGHG